MICRLCFNKSIVDFLNIFDTEGIRLQIADIISKHFWFSPSKDDPISDKICCSCWIKVNNFHEFYCFVENAHKNLINITESSNTSQSSSTFIPITLADMKEEQIFTDEEVNNALELENLSVAKNTKVEFNKEDPLNESNMKTEEETAIKKTTSNKTKYQKKSIWHRNKISNMNNKNNLSNEDAVKNLKSDRSEISSKIQNVPCAMLSSDVNEETTIKKVPELKTRKRGPYRKSLKQRQNEVQKNNRKQKTELERLEQQKKIEEEDQQIAKFIRMDCDICHQNFETFSQLKRHIFKEHQISSGYVICCNKKIFKRISLLQHVNFHINPDIFSCKLCDKKFKNADNLKYHIECRHELDDSKCLVCDICQKKFMKQNLFDSHKLTHASPDKRQFKCKTCEKLYPSEAHLKYHVRAVHERVYDLVCDICAKVVKCKKLLEKHRLEHAGVKEPRIQCQKCGVWLKNKSCFNQHMKRHDEALMGLKCEICGKQVVSRMSLFEHIKNSHSKQRIYKCTFCEKSFKERRSLKEHMTTHTGGALYTCSFCPQTFNSNANMYSHRKKVHPKEWERVKRQRITPISDSKIKSDNV